LVRPQSVIKAQKLWFYDKIDWVIGDLHDIESLKEAVEGVEVVLHAAALISFEQGSLLALLNENVKGTALLINTCLASKNPPHFVHISSISAITGERNQTMPLNGQSTTLPDSLSSHYGLSKYLQELEVWRGVEEGLTSTILSPGFILGVRMDGSTADGSASIFQYVLDQKPFYTLGILNYVALTDVTKAILLAVEKRPEGRHVLVGGNCTYKSFFEQCAAIMKIPAPKWHLKPWMSQSLSKIIGIVGRLLPLKLMVSPDSLKASQRKTMFSGAEAAETIGFEYETLQETLETAIRRIQKNR